jgi:glucokinase-like ROK family protein
MILVNQKEPVVMSVNEQNKSRHKKAILRLLYFNNPLSAPELSKKIGISLPTTLLLLQELTNSGLISVKGTGVSTGGRKPSVYGLSDDSLYVIACDMGRFVAKLTIFNTNNKKISPARFIETHIDDEDLVPKLHTAAMELTRKLHVPHEKIIGLGIDMPGLVDSREGINYTIKNQQFQNIRERLEHAFRTYVYIDNDARMQAYGEYVFGKAKSCRNAIIINWSWGIGMGMILNGELYGGNTGFAGEFSHIQMDEGGDLCICGKRGCLETVASANTILRMARKGISENIVSQLTGQFSNHPEDLTPEDVINAARSGDEFSISILSKVGYALGKGLSVVIQLMNPEIIVLGGPIAKANQFVLTPIQQALNKYCLEKILANTVIVTSEIDEQAGLLGCAATLYQQIFSYSSPK